MSELLLWRIIIFSYLSYLILRFLHFVYVHRYRKPLDLPERYGRDTWAVVTGSTDGLGKEFAIQCAEKGFNVLLLARDRTKLEQTAFIIQSKGVLSRFVVADFSLQSEEMWQAIAQAIENLDVRLLINNVGAATQLPEYFYRLSIEEIQKVINVNVTTATRMTRIVLPKLLGAGKGGVIFTSSQAGIHAVPMMSVYSGTKAYLRLFSAALKTECKGIDILCAFPGQVVTPMLEGLFGLNQETGWWEFLTKGEPPVISANQCVQDIIKQLGHQKETAGNWKHEVLLWMGSILPSYFYASEAHDLMKRLRSKAIKKQQDETKSPRREVIQAQRLESLTAEASMGILEAAEDSKIEESVSPHTKTVQGKLYSPISSPTARELRETAD